MMFFRGAGRLQPQRYLRMVYSSSLLFDIQDPKHLASLTPKCHTPCQANRASKKAWTRLVSLPTVLHVSSKTDRSKIKTSVKMHRV